MTQNVYRTWVTYTKDSNLILVGNYVWWPRTCVFPLDLDPSCIWVFIKNRSVMFQIEENWQVTFKFFTKPISIACTLKWNCCWGFYLVLCVTCPEPVDPFHPFSHIFYLDIQSFHPDSHGRFRSQNLAKEQDTDRCFTFLKV